MTNSNPTTGMPSAPSTTSALPVASLGNTPQEDVDDNQVGVSTSATKMPPRQGSSVVKSKFIDNTAQRRRALMRSLVVGIPLAKAALRHGFTHAFAKKLILLEDFQDEMRVLQQTVDDNLPKEIAAALVAAAQNAIDEGLPKAAEKMVGLLDSNQESTVSRAAQYLLSLRIPPAKAKTDGPRQQVNIIHLADRNVVVEHWRKGKEGERSAIIVDAEFEESDD